MSELSTPLVFEDVVVDYERKGLPDVRAVAGVSLSVQLGQVHGLVGESGCGKSTLARAATGLVPLAGGRIEFEGETVRPLGMSTRPPHFRRLQLIFQDANSSLNPRRTIGDQLTDTWKRSSHIQKDEGRMQVIAALERVGLSATVAEQYPSDFSGGQRQRICVARALVTDPTVIVADEPISALDASAQARMSNLLASLARELDIGILFISHDLAIVRQIADVVTVMYLGKVVEQATTADLWDEPRHPYSQALMTAVPAHDGAGVLPEALEGDIPDPSRPPPGCRFHPRCKFAFSLCSESEPPLASMGSRSSACWLTQDQGPLPEDAL